MENLLIYFLKANGLLILFYLMYFIFLRKETFFTSNRWYLIGGLVLSLILPLITFTKTILVEPAPIPELYEEAIPIVKNAIEVPIQENPLDWYLILITAYLVISTLIIMKIVIELVSFFNKIRKYQRQIDSDFTLIYSNATENPFSFFHYVVINPNRFSTEEFHHILTHERIHVQQKHSVDVLLGKLFCAFFWVNPFIWFYRKAMLQNLEFIADNQTLQHIENKYQYQHTLLKVVTHQHNLGITNQFYQSLIKKRIVMLHTNQSHKKNAWKYATILPLLVGFMFLFQVKTVAQVKERKTEETSFGVSSSYSSILTKNTTNNELRALEKTFSDDKRTLKISKVKRNKNGEIIEIKLSFDTGKTYNRVLERKSTEGIDDIKIFINSDKDDNETCGFEEVTAVAAKKFNATEENGKVQVTDEGWTIDNVVEDGKEAIIIVNGIIQTGSEKIKIPLDQEIDTENKISAQQAKEKYNINGKEGELYYEIITKKVGKKESTGWGLSFETETSSAENLIEDLKKSEKTDYKKSLIIFDGNEISSTELDKIDPNIVSSVSTLNSTKYTIKKYGEKANNGVIEIESIEYNKKNNPVKIDEKTNVNFRLNNDNAGFVISKNSKKEDLDFYKSTLSQNNIKFEFSAIERNEKNQITSITIQLSENSEIKKKIIKSNNVIPKIFIGKRNGSLIIIETK